VTITIACAVVRDDPPEVFIAEDLETLNWVLALKLMARVPATGVADDLRRRLRLALVEANWAAAVEAWMQIRPGEIDVYPSHELFARGDVSLAPDELQFTPLFQD
jgi:hypothetical protein